MTKSTSKNIDGVQEITLLAPLKLRVVPCTGKALSYASRLRLFLSALFEQRKLEIETNRKEDSFLESLQILDFVRWAIIDGDSKLMLAVSFDGPWEPYIRKIVDEAGPVLDAIFCHCTDYAGNSCYDGYPKFSAWVRKYQLDVPYIHVANAELSVDDVRYLKTFEAARASGNEAPISLQKMTYGETRQPLSRVYSLFGLRSLFVGEAEIDLNPADPGPLTDRQYLDRVAHAILAPDFLKVGPALRAVGGAIATESPAYILGLRTVATTTWFEQLASGPKREAHRPGPAMDDKISNSDRKEVQGNILTSYAETKGISHGAFALVRFKSQAKGAAFLERITRAVSFEGDPRPIKLNLALTFEGLKTLGLSKDELALFPQEFREGLEERAALLGDIGDNHPEHWTLPKANWGDTPSGHPVRLSLVDAVLNLQKDSPDDQSHELLKAFSDFLKKHEAYGEIEILHVQPTRRFDNLGHLGAVDGKSQPVANGEPNPYGPRDVVPVGELLLGYKNRALEPSSVPEELSLNSTFLAIRKMSQDPAVYAALDRTQLELALGRKADGTNLVNGKPDNEFDYSQPADDAKCPLFSHVRRSNPRTGDIPRILRRGMSYGPKFSNGDTKAERGVMFLAFAASLADQYEVVQRWVNGGNHNGVFSGHPDLIAGTYPHNTGRKLECPAGTISVPSKPAAVLEWGLYAFVPSRSALALLGSRKRPALVAQEKAAEPPQQCPFQSQFGVDPLSEKGDEWKARLEDVLRPDAVKDTLVGLLGETGFARPAEFGAIIGAPKLVTRALTNPKVYSVRNYWKRMEACEATLYLGMDPDPQPLPKTAHDPYLDDVPAGRYRKEADAANEFIKGIEFPEAFAAARKAAQNWFTQQNEAAALLGRALQKLDSSTAAAAAAVLAQPVSLDLVALGQRVVRDVACELYGLPTTLLSDDLELEWPAGTAPATAETAVRCPVDLTQVFAHVFPPRPSRVASETAVMSGPRINDKVSKWYDEGRGEGAKASRLINAIPVGQRQSSEFVVRTIIGLLSGFAVPTFGTLVGVLSQLVASDELWRLQRLPPIDGKSEKSARPILERVYDLMINRPVPAMVTRTAVAREEIPPVKPAEEVGLHLGYAAAVAREKGYDDAWKFLFGDLPEHYAGGSNGGSGPGSRKKATHACPGQDMALGVIVGTIVALLEQPRLKKTMNPLVLSQYPIK